MGKFHSMVSRRDFMKGLGLAGAGLGAVAATAPVFHDLDEVMQVGKSSMMVRPWYVKEVAKPTVEIDFNLRTQFGTNGETNIVGGMLGGSADYNSSPQLVGEWNALWKSNLERDILKDGTPGNTCPGSDRRDIVFHRAGLGSYTKTRPSGGFRYATPDQIVSGLGKWTGTPEDNALMMRTVCQAFGYSWVGYVNLDDNSVGPRRRLFSSGRVFDDTDDYYMDGQGVRHYPKSCNTLIELIGQTGGHWKDIATETVRGCGHNYGRTRKDAIENFIWSMGYQTFTPSSQQPAWQILAGLSEYNRTHGPGVTPEGHVQKTTSELITDMPLAPTNPIDFGVLEFCKTCGKCADACPGGAIPTAAEMKEPTWDRATGKWSASNDHCGYPNRSDKCWTIWAVGRDGKGGIRGGFYPLPAIQCSTCTWACPFAKGVDSWIHTMVGSVIGTTSILNSFFVSMDNFVGYGDVLPDKDLVDSFWTTPHTAFLLDNSIMGTK